MQRRINGLGSHGSAYLICEKTVLKLTGRKKRRKKIRKKLLNAYQSSHSKANTNKKQGHRLKRHLSKGPLSLFWKCSFRQDVRTNPRENENDGAQAGKKSCCSGNLGLEPSILDKDINYDIKRMMMTEVKEGENKELTNEQSRRTIMLLVFLDLTADATSSTPNGVKLEFSTL